MADLHAPGKGTARSQAKLRACAECRRLKLRCDKNVPCQACIRRGCSSLCPDKCFTAEATPSSLKATNLRSREEIESLKSRVTALESALAATQPSHPLLTPGNSPEPLGSPAESPETALEDTVDIFSNLSIAENGSTVFHGATSMSEFFVMGQETSRSPDSQGLPTDDQPNLPSNLQLLSVLSPFPPHSVVSASDPNDLLPFLPPAKEAMQMTDRYWHHFSLGIAPITQHQFKKQIFDTFYPMNETKTHLARSDSHRLGLLFITLALSLLSDNNKPMASTEAETYYLLARAALSLDPVCENTTITALQTLVSMNWYMRAARRTSSGYAWAFSGIIVKLASAVGLFRNSQKWLTDPDEIGQREVLCWEVICLDIWQAFILGRPCNIDLTLVDCPRPPEDASGSAGLPGLCAGSIIWKHRFFPLINNVLLVVLRPGPVKYSEILHLESGLRECSVPKDLTTLPNESPLDRLPDDATTTHLQRFTVLMWKETAFCLLHRRFLVLAIQTNPDDPKSTPFKHSAFQACRSAVWIVNSTIIMYRRYPELISRVAGFWSMSFSAGVILGAVAARYWDRDYAQWVLDPFEKICLLFAQAEGTSIQPFHALECLQRLQRRVRTHFPQNPESGLADDLPLLGVQPRAGFPSDGIREQQSNLTPDSSETSIDVAGNLSSEMFHATPDQEGAGMAFSPSPPLDTTAWTVPDLTFLIDEKNGGLPLDWSSSDQAWQPSWIDGVSNSPLGGTVSGPSRMEVGQWDQFLDNLGVWG